MKKRFNLVPVAFLASAVMATIALAQTAIPPSLGDRAPTLTVDGFLDAADRPFEPGEFDWETFRGRVIVVEFSASWCAPCIAAIPHLHGLWDALNDEPVEFWTVTNERPERAARLRDRHGLDFPIALDPDGSTFWDYWVQSIPFVAIIDAQGCVAALTDPMSIDERSIREILEGRTVDLPLVNPNPTRTNWSQTAPGPSNSSTSPDAGDPLALVSITRVDTAGFGGSLDRESGRIEIPGFPLRLLVRIAFAAHPHLDNRVRMQDDEFFRVRVIPPDADLRTARSLLATMLTETFDLEVRQETRLTPVSRLIALTPPKTHLDDTDPDSMERSIGPGSIVLPSAEGADIAEALSRATGRIVLDETGLPRPVRFVLQWNVENDDFLAPALRALGFDLVEGEADLEFTVISRPGEP